MEKLAVLATLINNTIVKIDLCDVIPDFVHAVKYDHNNNLEIYFSADDEWTSDLENQAFDLTQSTYALHTNNIAV